MTREPVSNLVFSWTSS